MNQKNSNFADSVFATYAISVTSATIAELLTYPLDLTKTRLQIQGEMEKSSVKVASSIGFTSLEEKKIVQAHGPVGAMTIMSTLSFLIITSSKFQKESSLSAFITAVEEDHRGMLKTAIGIGKEEGLLKLWQGITPAIYRHVVYSGIRIVTYENMRDNVLKKDDDGSFPVWKSAVSGITSGVIAQFFASPTDLVKVQIQMEGKRRLLGKPARVHGAGDAFQKIIKSGGIRGLWKGSVPNMYRAALVNLGDLTTYDTAKQFMINNVGLPDSHLTHVLASTCAGLVAATMGTPADVIKTRIMNQPTDINGRGLYYKSSLDCLMKTVQSETFFALYKGFFPIWIRMAPWSLTFWLSFEQIKHSVGASAF